MKPLLIIPPCPVRWPSLESLLIDQPADRLHDLNRRLCADVPDAGDACAVIADGGLALASAAVARRHDVGVLLHLFTRETHRRRGHARGLLATLLSWFDMVGGKWLYTIAPAEPAAKLLATAGFAPLHEPDDSAPDRPQPFVRRASGVSGDSLDGVAPTDVTTRDVTRADYPLLVALLLHRPGADPRVPPGESTAAAEATALQLLAQQDAGTCQLKAAALGERIVGLASLATDQLGERSYAMRIPHTEPLDELRDAVVELARSKGYAHVDFPLEQAATHPTAEPPTQTGP